MLARTHGENGRGSSRSLLERTEWTPTDGHPKYRWRDELQKVLKDFGASIGKKQAQKKKKKNSVSKNYRRHNKTWMELSLTQLLQKFVEKD